MARTAELWYNKSQARKDWRNLKKISILAIALAMTTFAKPAADYATRDIFASGEFFIGCNYWAKNASMYMWSQWRPEIVEQELATLSRYGTRVMRVFPLWSDFQPLTGDCRAGGSYRSYRFRDNQPLPNEAGVDEEMMKRFRLFCDMAQKYDIKLIVGIVTGWMSSRQFVRQCLRNATCSPTLKLSCGKRDL